MGDWPNIVANGPTGRIAVRLNNNLFSWETAQPLAATPQLAPPPPAAQPVPQQVQSTPNWGGYVLTGGPFVAINADWRIPDSVTGSSYGQSVWPGIGGWNGAQPLLQAGSEIRYDSTIAALTSLLFNRGMETWLEDWPAPQANIGADIWGRPGDQLEVNIQQVSGPTWTVTVRNLTVGQSQTYTANYNPATSSAEWIVEAFGEGCPMGVVSLSCITTFANTAPVTFFDCWAKTADGRILTPMDAQRVTLVQNGTLRAFPSAPAPHRQGKAGPLP
jgi:hypothetical protein